MSADSLTSSPTPSTDQILVDLAPFILFIDPIQDSKQKSRISLPRRSVQHRSCDEKAHLSAERALQL